MFDYKGKQYSYNRLTDKLTLFEKKEENKESLEPTYTWMNFSPNKKYILYAKNHNLYIKGNKALGGRYNRSAVDRRWYERLFLCTR